MRRTTLLWVFSFFALPSLFAEVRPAQDAGVLGRQALSVGERVEFHSSILGETVSMNLYLPESFHDSSSEHTYPVIFANGSHGEEFFHLLAGLTRHLGHRERMPESIVVSLNDMGPIPRIFTHGMWSVNELGPDGDPAKGVRHLREEVIPWLEREYRANHYRILIGVSGSTLFPIHTLTAAPGLFESYILVAAADTLGMGESEDSTFIDSLAGAFGKSPERRVRLYVGVAESDVAKRADYRANLEALKQRLVGLDGLTLGVDIFPRSDHYEVFIDAVRAGLDQNFPFERWSSRYRELVAQPGDALANIDRYYRTLSRDYGFAVLPRADRWNSVNCLRFMTRHLIREGRPAEALAVARRRVRYQPERVGSHTGLADALEAVGDVAAAVAAQEQALRLARRHSPDSLGRVQERLEELRAKSVEPGAG
ncbi:MAG: alpha/beta hydrolase-fold protein [Acidobacteriota bacterium]